MASRITIDGSFGEGGGQVLRSSLALSLITGKPFEIHHIRSKRKKPGLMAQHLTSVNAAVEIGCAKVSGNIIGSTTVIFDPTCINAGNYHFNIGTAGSCTLVLQTILLPLMISDKPSSICIEGGTHNPFAPPYDFLKKAFLPLIQQMGPEVSIQLITHGFYPKGGGKIEVNISPSKELKHFTLCDRGQLITINAIAKVAQLPESIAQRELKTIAKKMNITDNNLHLETINNSNGPGNVVSVEIQSEHCTEVFTEFGKIGVSAEKVASKVARSASQYLLEPVAVGKYLADQLLMPMAMTGKGKFTTLAPSQHTLTNIEIIKKFLDVEFRINHLSEQCVEIEIV